MIHVINKTARKPELDVIKLGQLSVSMLVIYYMWYNEKFGHNTVIVYGSFLVMCVSLIIDLVFNRNNTFENCYFGIWWNYVVALYAFATGIFVAYNYGSLFNGLRLILQYSTISFCIYYFASKSENGIDWLLITINGTALLCCLYLVISPVEILRGRYAISLHNNPNTLGFMLVIGVFSIAYRFRPSIRSIILYFPQFLLMMYGIVLTGSRKALISAVVFSFIWTIKVLIELWKIQYNWKQLITIIAFIIVLFAGARFLISVYSRSAVALRMVNFFDEDSNGNRINYYRAALEILLNKPLFGGGLDQFKYWSGLGGYAHSTFAEAIADFGIIGCLIYFFPILDSGRRLVCRIINEDNNYISIIVFALWGVEIFMGIGQIFFVDIMHYIAWIIIYINVSNRLEMNINTSRYKYIK